MFGYYSFIFWFLVCANVFVSLLSYVVSGVFLVVVILICAFLRDAPFVYLPIMIICFCFILFDFIMIP